MLTLELTRENMLLFKLAKGINTKIKSRIKIMSRTMSKIMTQCIKLIARSSA